MNDSELQDFSDDIFTEVAGGRIDSALVICLKHGHRPAWYLLRKTWAGVVVADRWVRRNYVDLSIAFVWLGLLAFLMGKYDGKGEEAPIAVQLALVVPFLGFAAMVVADWWRRFNRRRKH